MKSSLSMLQTEGIMKYTATEQGTSLPTIKPHLCHIPTTLFFPNYKVAGHLIYKYA